MHGTFDLYGFYIRQFVLLIILFMGQFNVRIMNKYGCNSITSVLTSFCINNHISALDHSNKDRNEGKLIQSINLVERFALFSHIGSHITNFTT